MPAKRSDELARAALPEAHAVVPARTGGPPTVRAESNVRDLPLVSRQSRERLEFSALLRGFIGSFKTDCSGREERPEEKGVVVGAGDEELWCGTDEGVVSLQRCLLR